MELEYPPKYDLNEYGQGIGEFDPERDLKISPGWMCDAVHTLPAMSPMATYDWIHDCGHGWQLGASMTSCPYERVVTARSVRGVVYLTSVLIEDEAEIKQREVKFREYMAPLIGGFNKLYSSHKEALATLYAPLKRVDLDKASDSQLSDYWYKWMDLSRTYWDLHMIMIWPASTITALFIDMCRDLVGIDETSPLFLRLFQGFHNALLEADAELEKFGLRAAERGLKDIFMGSPEASVVIPKLEASIDGRNCLKEFREFLDYAGWRMPKVWDYVTPSWIEDPTPALTAIKNCLAAGTEGVLREARKAGKEDRKKAEDEVLSKIPEARREEFKTLLRSAQDVHVASDEHDFFYDMPTMAIGRRIMMGIGRRFVNNGMIDNPEDIVYLVPDEVEQIILSHMDIHYLVNKRKELHRQYLSEMPRPPSIGTIGVGEIIDQFTKAREYNVMMYIVGTLPKVRPELKADLYGIGASGGIAEGPARVAVSETELKEVHKGEILVCPSSYSAWTWAFSLIGGVVTDRGGISSHASIVGREYRIPAVLNTFEGTAKIKTGQMIRVDGNEGVVYILD